VIQHILGERNVWVDLLSRWKMSEESQIISLCANPHMVAEALLDLEKKDLELLYIISVIKAATLRMK
jgi:hypothetical protein